MPIISLFSNRFNPVGGHLIGNNVQITPTPSPTPTHLVTVTPTPTNSVTPTITPTNSVTPTPTPTNAPSFNTGPFTFDFDYMVVEYFFSDGNDMDTMTYISNPTIMFDDFGNVSPGDYVGTCALSNNGPQFPNNGVDNPYLIYGGDNTGTGTEAVLFNLVEYKNQRPSDTNIEITFTATWYGTPGTEPVIMRATMWKGGTPVQDGFTFINNTATLTQMVESNGKIITSNLQTCESFESVSKFQFNITNYQGQFIDDINLTPTPTSTITPSITPTLTPTPSSTQASSPSSKSWAITQCSSSCDGNGYCDIINPSSITVYTLQSVTNITDPSSIVYSDSSLTTRWSGYYYWFDIDTIFKFTNGVSGLACQVGVEPCIP